MYKRCILGLLFCFLGIYGLYAADVTVKADNITAHSQTAKTTVSLPIYINSDVDVTSLQVDLHLPGGFTFCAANRGDVASTSHVITTSNKDGYTRIILYSNQNQVLKAKSGIVLNITIDVDTALVSKDYDVLLKNINVSDASSPSHRYGVPDQHSVISVTTLAERIILSDKMVEVGIGASKQISATVYPAYTTNKDIKWTSENELITSVEDGLITGKTKGLTDIIVTPEDGSNISAVCHTYSDCSMLYSENISGHSQSVVQEVVIPIKYNANADNSSLQFDLYLPEGFYFKSALKGEIANTSHVVTSSTKEGFTRVVLYSPQNQPFKARSGAAVNITLEVDTALASKDYDILMKDIYISDLSKSANRYSVSDQHTTISLTTLAEKIIFTSPFTVLRQHETTSLSPIILPYYTTDKRLVFNSSDISVVKIEGNEAKAIKQGLVTVTVDSQDGSGISVIHHLYSECSMLYMDNRTVYSQSNDNNIRIPVILNAFNNISHFQFDLYLPDGFTFLNVEKSNLASNNQTVLAENKDGFTRVLYYASDNSFVSQNKGEVLYLNINVNKQLDAKCYEAYIRNTKLSAMSQPATLYEMPDWNIKFNVTTLAESITLNKDTLELYDGQSELLNVMILPDFTENKILNWKSLDMLLANVDSQGLVQVVGDGTTQIIVSTTDGSNLSDTCIVIVKPVLATALKMCKDTITIEDQCSYQLSCEILPQNVTHHNLTWISDDSSVAMVDATGYVVAKKVGSTTIHANTTDGTMLSDSCEINVIPLLVNEISFSSDTINIGKEIEMPLSVVISPENATDKTLKWESTQDDVASVNEYGVVYTKQVGVTKIIATSFSNPSICGECTLVVHGIESQTTALLEPDNIVNLEWKTKYNKFDIKDYNVYVSENDQPFVLWIPNTSFTTVKFKQKDGVSYKFLVTSRDTHDNVEKYDEAKCVTVK